MPDFLLFCFLDTKIRAKPYTRNDRSVHTVSGVHPENLAILQNLSNRELELGETSRGKASVVVAAVPVYPVVS